MNRAFIAFAIVIGVVALLLQVENSFEAQDAKAPPKKAVKKEAKAPAKAVKIKIVGYSEHREFIGFGLRHPMSDRWGYTRKNPTKLLLSLPLTTITRRDIAAFALGKNFKVTTELDKENLLQSEVKAADDRKSIGGAHPRGDIHEVEEGGTVWWKPSRTFNTSESESDLRFLVDITAPARGAKEFFISGDILFSGAGKPTRAEIKCVKSDKPGKIVFEDKEAKFKIEINEIGKRSTQLGFHGDHKQVASISATGGNNTWARYFNNLGRARAKDEATIYWFTHDGGLPLTISLAYRKSMKTTTQAVTLKDSKTLLEKGKYRPKQSDSTKPDRKAVKPIIRNYREFRMVGEKPLRYYWSFNTLRDQWASIGLEYELKDDKALVVAYALDPKFHVSVDGSTNLLRENKESHTRIDEKDKTLVWRRGWVASSVYSFPSPVKGALYMVETLDLAHKKNTELELGGLVHLKVLKDISTKSVKAMHKMKAGTLVWEDKAKTIKITLKEDAAIGRLVLEASGAVDRLFDFRMGNKDAKYNTAYPMFFSERTSKYAKITIGSDRLRSLKNLRDKGTFELTLSFQVGKTLSREKLTMALSGFKLP